MSKQKSMMCSFCGKLHKEVRKLIAGPGVYICDSCVVTCYRILEKELPNAGAPLGKKSPPVFQSSAAETQASLTILQDMKRDKSISVQEFITLSRRLLAALPTDSETPEEPKDEPIPTGKSSKKAVKVKSAAE